MTISSFVLELVMVFISIFFDEELKKHLFRSYQLYTLHNNRQGMVFLSIFYIINIYIFCHDKNKQKTNKQVDIWVERVLSQLTKLLTPSNTTQKKLEDIILLNKFIKFL